MNHIREDSSIFVGQNDGKSSMSELITSVHISCIYSEMNCFHRPSSHIARQWHLCWVTWSTILQRIRTSSRLIRTFRLEQPVQSRIMPKWDLNLVLSALMRPPFASEVDDRGRISDYVIDLRLHMMKTVFLQAFASAQRWSYLHALSVVSGRCVFGRGNIQRQSGVPYCR